MTFKAFTIGIIAAVLIASFGYVNDWLLDLERFNSGHLLPIVVVGPLLLFSGTINCLLHRFCPKLAFKGAELAVIFFLASTACSITGRNLMEHLPHVMVMPHHWYQVTPGWRALELEKYFPKNGLVDPEYREDVVSGFVNGVGRTEDLQLGLVERNKTRFERVPWGAWLPPIKLWVPIALLSALCFACLSLIVHRQWSEHEHLPYPIADFISSFMVPGKKSGIPDIFSKKLFWIGLLMVLIIRVNNGLCNWFPEYLIPVKLIHNFMPFSKVFPSVLKAPMGAGIFRVEIFPLVIAFAFMLSTEVSLTLGLSQILSCLVTIPLVSIGVDMTCNLSGMGLHGWQRAASYVAFGAILLYTGRNYYWSVVRRSVLDWKGCDDGNGVENSAVWAFRVFVVAMVAWVFLVVRTVGLPLPFAALTFFLGALSAIVVGRIGAETGLFFIHTRWQPYAFMIAMLGGTFMNPSVLVATTMVCFVLSIDQSQGYLPYLMNALKVGDRLKLPNAKMTTVSYVTCGASIFTALLVSLVMTYDRGTPKQCLWSWGELAKICFVGSEPEVLQLKSVDTLEMAEKTPWYSKLSTIHSKKYFWHAVAFGIAGVLLFSFLRLRYTWWPLHPVLFLVWVTWPMHILASSFLMGWLLKKLTVRVGGFAMVQRLKSFMFGVVGGEILGAVVFMIVGAIYFLVTDKPPIAYRYFPR